jgi:glycine oxidase
MVSEAPMPQSAESATGSDAEAIVVGAGVIGAAIAFELASRGARVRVLERGTPASGATYASAGMLVPYAETEPGSLLQQICGESLARYDEFVSRVRQIVDVPVEYVRRGTLQVAVDEQGHRHLESTVRALSAHGIPCELLDGRAARAAEPALSPTIVSGAIVHVHGFVAAEPLTRALLAAAQRNGAVLETEVEVTHVAPLQSGAECETSRGIRRATQVVIAAGCWSGQLPVHGQPRKPVRPVRGQLVYLAGRERPFSRILWGPGCYIVGWADGSILVGATVEEVGFDEQVTAGGVSLLLRESTSLVPGLTSATFVGARVGLRPATPDGLPVIGASAEAPHIVYATGHYRNGVLLAPITAAMVADLLMDERRHPALESLGPDRFLTRHAEPDD